MSGQRRRDGLRGPRLVLEPSLPPERRERRITRGGVEPVEALGELGRREPGAAGLDERLERGDPNEEVAERSPDERMEERVEGLQGARLGERRDLLGIEAAGERAELGPSGRSRLRWRRVGRDVARSLRVFHGEPGWCHEPVASAWLLRAERRARFGRCIIATSAAPARRRA